ncbi:MAG: DUF447 family protein [Methylobacter sp.]|nr:MAG: DUF447 family protein [Methylobacter sp.]
MIQETIVITQNSSGQAHIAPMGIHTSPGAQDEFIILPFRPSTTLNNLLESKTAVINYCDDVRVFAGCLIGRRDWPLKPAEKIHGQVLKCALAHTEVELVRVEDDETRPKLVCKTVHSANHAPFMGFNRAQYSVLEAAILISRLNRIPLKKIQAEIDYLRIGLEKTAGDRELEAWAWLMTAIENYSAANQSGTGSTKTGISA